MPLERSRIISVIAASPVQTAALFRAAARQLRPSRPVKASFKEEDHVHLTSRSESFPFHGFPEKTNFTFVFKFPSQQISNCQRRPVQEKALCVSPATGLQAFRPDGHSFLTLELQDFTWAFPYDQLALRPSDNNPLLESTLDSIPLHCLQSSSGPLVLSSVSPATSLFSDRYFGLLERTV